jgi:low affinity Fe/Cu permease
MADEHDNDEHRGNVLTRAVGRLTDALGSFPAIAFSAVIIITWLIGGLFVKQHFSNNTYQLVINTTTTIITFMMVFIIQNTQNRDGRAVQTKLDAQNEALFLIAKKLGIEDDMPMLEELIGVEEDTSKMIKAEQAKVRQSKRTEAALKAS